MYPAYIVHDGKLIIHSLASNIVLYRFRSHLFLSTLCMFALYMSRGFMSKDIKHVFFAIDVGKVQDIPRQGIQGK